MALAKYVSENVLGDGSGRVTEHVLGKNTPEVQINASVQVLSNSVESGKLPKRIHTSSERSIRLTGDRLGKVGSQFEDILGQTEILRLLYTFVQNQTER